MKRFFLMICILSLMSGTAFAWSGYGSGNIKVQEIDLDPIANGITTLEFTNGTVTISGKKATITIAVEDNNTEPAGSGDITITLAQCKRGVLTDKNLSGNADFVLDDEAVYMSLKILIVVGTHTISVVPPAGEKIWMDGTALDANDEIDLSNAEGDKFIVTRRYSGADAAFVWDLDTARGTASDGGAGD